MTAQQIEEFERVLAECLAAMIAAAEADDDE